MYIDADQSTWEHRSKVPSPGRYHIIVKFFQPNHSQFNLIYRINTDKSIYDGKIPLRNCPSNSGCRELIKQDNGYIWFEIEEGITITLTVSHNLGKYFNALIHFKSKFKFRTMSRKEASGWITFCWFHLKNSTLICWKKRHSIKRKNLFKNAVTTISTYS